MFLSVTALVVMLLMPMATHARDWTFGSYPDNTYFTDGGTVPTSANGSLMLLKDNTYNQLEDRFAVKGTTTEWYIHNNGLYAAYGNQWRAFSILNVSPGDKVTISYDNTRCAADDNVKRSITFVASGQVEGKSAGEVVPNNQEFYVMDSGSLDLNVPRYLVINTIKVEAGTGSVTLTNNSDLKGYAKWNATTKQIEYVSSASEGLPYYRVRLSSRTFLEPTVTVSSGNNPTWTIVNYGPSAGASYNPKDGTGKKTVAVMGEGTEVMFINPGWCKVIASYQGKSASYLVECWDNDASYKVEEVGNAMKYSFAANDTIVDVNQQGGILQNRVITAVPGIEVKIGIPEMDEGDAPGANNDNSDYHHQPNTAVVQRWTIGSTDHYVSWINDDAGWWDRTPHNNSSWPQQGSYYTFTATADGILRFGGVKQVKDENQNGEVYLVNLDDVGGYRPLIVSNQQPAGYYTSDNNFSNGIELKAGQRYCLHGEANPSGYWNGWQWVDTSKWAPYFLEWFSFEPKFAIREYYGISDKNGDEIPNNGSCKSNKVIYATSLDGWNATIMDQNADVSNQKSYKGTVYGATASIQSDGTIQLSNLTFTTDEASKRGGAVKVILYKGTPGQSGYQQLDFVMTIPYGKHVWDFRQTAHQNSADTERFKKGDYSYTPAELVQMMNNNGTDWNRVYKVRHRADGHWTLLISPILAARGSVIGNNAFYMDNTNGLVFLTAPDCFGAEETANQHGSEYEKDHGLKDIDDDEEFGYDYTTVIGADKVWMSGDNGGASILFPGVKAGQYIKIYTYRHADKRGETFKAKNLVDLDNVAYSENTPFLMRGFANGTVYPAMVGDNMRGCAIFRVPENYNPTNDPDALPRLTLCDIGWTQIYRIEIMDEYDPDLLLAVNMGDDTNGYWVPVEYDAVTSSIVLRNGQSQTRDFLAIAAYTGCQNANTCEYKVYPDTGVGVGVARSIWNSKPNGSGVDYNDMKLTFNSGNGLVRIVQREKATTDMDKRNTVTTEEAGAAGYVIDKNEYYIAVGELNPQTYPYTWDFSTYNLYKSPSTTKADLGSTTQGEYGDWDAIANNSNGFGQHHYEEVAFCPEDTYLHDENYTINKHLFAQGAMLTDGNEVTENGTTTNQQTVIIETEGLGVRRPYGTDKQFPYLHSVDNVYQVDNRPYGTYDLEDGGISFDGSVLSGIGEMTIPDVDNGMYIFVQSNAAPTSVTINGETVQAISQFDKYASATDIPAGVYAYKNTGDKGDVVLNFDESTGIVKIGVTDIHKEVNDIGYATESRNHAIDHTYTGQFTTSDVNAYGVLLYGDSETPYDYKGYPEVHKTDEVTVIPANTGAVLYGAETQGRRYEFPLFYPACNVVPTADDITNLKKNWMAPNVEETTHDSEIETASTNSEVEGWAPAGIDCTKFVMTRYHFVWKKNSEGEGIDTEEGDNGKIFEQDVEAFYRLRIDPNDASKNVLGANKAYLLVPSEYLETALWNGGTNGYAGMFYIDLADVEGFGDVDPTSIDTVQDVTYENNVYYTLTGIRLNGKPTVKGFYLCNGKKVYVK